MTATLISLISIFTGILGANIMGFVFKNYSFGLIGNTIAGVFGSIFILKSFGRLGFSPQFIVENESVNYGLFSLNCFISFVSGALAIVLISKIKHALDTKNKDE